MAIVLSPDAGVIKALHEPKVRTDSKVRTLVHLECDGNHPTLA